jgi:Uma2 family endonuclease
MSAILTPSPVSPANTPAVATMPIYQLSVEQYHAMARHGILTTRDPVELIHGWLVRKMTKRPPHTIATGLTQDALTWIQPAGWHVRVQEPITLDDSEPEPDCVLTQGARRDYQARHPGPGEVALVVEVSDSTLEYDRKVKRPLYAASRIPVYWIVNLEEGQVEVFTDPSGPAALPGYATQQILGSADVVAVLIAGQEVGRIPVRELLP